MSAAVLHRCLECELELIDAFNDALDAETAALMDRKAHEALRQAAESKEKLTGLLTDLSHQRDALLAAMGLPPGYQGTEQAVALHPELAETWDYLLEGIELARESNARNGIIINASLRATEETLEALRQLSQSPPVSTVTYDAQGHSRQLRGATRRIVAT
jgi:flagella synthesis protein FlgN